MQNIPEILKSIANISSTKEKENIIQENKSIYMKMVFIYAYHPHITFGVSKFNLTSLTYNENRIIDYKWFDYMIYLLTELSNRNITGNRARHKIEEHFQSGPRAWAELLYNILNKDLRIGAGTKIINRVYENLLPEEFCMLAKPFEDKRMQFPCYVDIKLDGVRGLAIPSGNKYGIYSRNGKNFKNFTKIEEELEILSKNLGKSITFDGEVTSGHFQDLMKMVNRKEDGLEMAKDSIYNIFDIVLLNIPLRERLEELEECKRIINENKLAHLNIITGIIVNNYAEIEEYYKEKLSNGFEGIMIKNLDTSYEYKRSFGWMKMKPTETEDIKIVGFEEGTGKFINILGAFICELESGNTIRVGSGFTDDQRKDYWEKKEILRGQIIEVKFQEKTKDGKLRFPIFVRFRKDKEEIV